MIYNKDDIDISLVQCPHEEEHGFIYISDEYTNNILKLSDYSDINVKDYHYLCRRNILADFLYEYALKSAKNAFFYSRDILKSRFEIGEFVISKDAQCSYRYAMDILNGRFNWGTGSNANVIYMHVMYLTDVLNLANKLLLVIVILRGNILN